MLAGASCKLSLGYRRHACSVLPGAQKGKKPPQQGLLEEQALEEQRVDRVTLRYKQ